MIAIEPAGLPTLGVSVTDRYTIVPLVERKAKQVPCPEVVEAAVFEPRYSVVVAACLPTTSVLEANILAHAVPVVPKLFVLFLPAK